MKKTVLILLMGLLYPLFIFAQCLPTAEGELSINNVNAGLLTGGDMFWDLSDGRYEVPKNSGKNAIFAAATWMGGIDAQGSLKVAAQTYRLTGNDFFPGPIDTDGSLLDEDCNNYDRLWKVRGTDIDILRSFCINGEAIFFEDIPQALLDWPGRNNPHFTDFALPEDKDLAPFWDANHDDIYNPMDGDYPVINSEIEGQYADEMVWWVYNDVGGTHEVTQSIPIGLEIGVLAYAFQANANNYINDATFYRYKLRYNGNVDFSNFYMGFFVDVDLGNFIDDYVGCDTTQNMGYVYNGDAFDDGLTGYGENPPMLGMKFIEGLNNEDKILSSFKYYNSDFTMVSNPIIAEDYYNYLKGLWKDGTPMTVGGSAYGGTIPTKYMFSGNPGGEGWSECSEGIPPADRRFLMTTGPVNFEANTERFMTVGMLYLPQGAANYPCPDITPLKNLAIQSNIFFDCLQIPNVCENATDVEKIEGKYSNEITIYPNPMTEKAVIDLSKLTEQVNELMVYNHTGKKVLQQPINNQTAVTIKRENLTNGVYYYQLKNEKNIIANGKVLIQ